MTDSIAERWADLPAAARAQLLLAGVPFPGETPTETRCRLMAQLRLVDDDGLAALLDNSSDTLVRWRIEGKGPRPIRVARMILYDLDDVREDERALALATHQRANERLNRAEEAARQSALSAVRALLILNGGSAIALLTFVGSLATSGEERLDPLVLTVPLRWFAYGAGAAVLCAVLAYLTSYTLVGVDANQRYQWTHPYAEDTSGSNWWRRGAHALHALAIIAGLLALGLYGWGVRAMIEAVG